mmetsp:Transcript_66045/g.123190  ORF Transcript_66045/g.123190 Transcript_66045/m.123190 type:complete len:203 (+) Transcript_66045:75-683(+)
MASPYRLLNSDETSSLEPRGGLTMSMRFVAIGGCVLGMTGLIALLATYNPGAQVVSQVVMDTKVSDVATDADIALVKEFSALDPASPKDLASVSKYFHKDAVTDLAGPDLPIASDTKGVAGVLDFLKFFGEQFDLKSKEESYYPGPEPGQVLWFWDMTAVNKANGKIWHDNGIDDIRVSAGQFTYLKTYWGHPSRLTEALSP